MIIIIDINNDTNNVDTTNMTNNNSGNVRLMVEKMILTTNKDHLAFPFFACVLPLCSRDLDNNPITDNTLLRLTVARIGLKAILHKKAIGGEKWKAARWRKYSPDSSAPPHSWPWLEDQDTGSVQPSKTQAVARRSRRSSVLL